MRKEVKKNLVAKEFYTPERCYISEIANDSGDEYISIARAIVEPGITTEWHKLNGVNERYIIISGQGRVELNYLDPIDVIEFDVVRIPADIPQRITNTGVNDLIFLAVCSPRFQPDCYVSLE